MMMIRDGMRQDSLGNRIKHARKRIARLTQKELADRVRDIVRKAKLSPQAVQLWEANKTEPSLDTIKAISTITGVSFIWLTTGAGAISEEVVQAAPLSSLMGRRVPVVDAAQTARGVVSPTVTRMTISRFECGARAYAVEVWDKSNAPRYRQGSLVIIDPDVSPLPGDMVFCALGASSAPAIRKYRLVAGAIAGGAAPVFEPLNPDWPVEMIGRVLGVVVEYSEPRQAP